MRRNSGFAMMLVLLMAALIAITLYMALPRQAFEAQREKEQTLVDRGNQYKRAIQLYVRQNKRWPAKVEDLEDANGKRYLRKRYIDPMTGKDEWRPIHVGPNGVLTDSLIKQKDKNTGSTYSNNFITELGGVGSTPDAANTVNAGLRKRPSDQIPGGDPGTGGSVGPPAAGSQGPPPAPFVGSGNYPSQPGQPNFPPGMQLPNPGQQTAGGLPQQLQNGNNPVTPPPATQSSGGISVLGGVGGGYSIAPGANGPAAPPGLVAQQGQNGLANGQPGSQSTPQGSTPANAAQLIQGLLTTPRPGGAPGTTSSAGQVIGGGLAGFASKFEGDSIKIYNEQQKYQLWEFVYDMSKDTMITGGQQTQPQANPNGQNSNTNTSSFFGNSGSANSTASPATANTTTTTGHDD